MVDQYSIRQLFDKERDPLRTLNTIIQVKDFSPESIWTEFEEFVLTDSLIKYLTQFCEHFMASIEFDGPKKPFWLEGFYGSGKSHFSKMIGYLFQNSELSDLSGKKWGSIDFFVDHLLKDFEPESPTVKKNQEYLLETLPLFPKQFNCKSLFIDLSDYSKSETTEEKFMESFTIALLKEFNKSLGLAESIEFAEVEKNMIREGIYEEFKQKVEESQEEKWEEVRKSGPWARRTFISIYSNLTKCDKIEASEYINGAKSECEQKTADNVLQEINDWAKKTLGKPEAGVQGKYLIILDEAGLFFSAKASRIGEMMSVSQWIQNRVNKSCINMIFNAQQKIRTYLDSVKADVDYRTAEQRFTHWFLDKKNIKSVVIKRWLKKDSAFGEQHLTPWLDAEFWKIIDGSVLDTIIDPNLEYKKPTKEDIYETYPFLPYQFPLMIQITQKLITEKIVEEQYGGKTRSILSMTRDVLNNSSKEGGSTHFVDETLGHFVTLPQLYDCITYTLKNKEEDQFILVNSTRDLKEDPKEFSPELRALPFSFFEVMKAILLLKHVNEIYSSDQNIAKSLYYSINCDRDLVLQKVKKLIDILKKNGNINYHKREIEVEDGSPKEIWEYKIASQEEKKWIKKTQDVFINDQEVANRLFTFFKDGGGKSLLNIRDLFNVTKLLDGLGAEYITSSAVKLKCVWEIDPKWDAIEKNFQDLTHQIGELSTDALMVVVFTPKTLQEHATTLDKLERKVQMLAMKALQKQKLVLFVCPSFSIPIVKIHENFRFIDESIRLIKKIEETKDKDSTIPTSVRQSFDQRILEIEKDIRAAFDELLNEGSIYYGNKARLRVSKDNIDAKLLQSTKELFSQINNKAYLGQIKPTSTDLEKILTFDPKKKSPISPLLRKSSKSPTENLYLFNEDGTVLQPNYCEQVQSISHEFQLLLQQNSPIESVSGEELKEKLTRPPYSWTMPTILACIAALIRDNQWDVLKKGAVVNSDDKLLIHAFKELKQDYGEFRALQFKIAEHLSHQQLTDTNAILQQLFNRGISKIGPEGLNDELVLLITEIEDLIVTTKDDLAKLPLPTHQKEDISLLGQNMRKIKDKTRITARITEFLTLFEPYLNDPAELKSFLDMKQILYRVGELKQTQSLDRYYWLETFLTRTMKDWLESNKSNSHIDYSLLSAGLQECLVELQNPECLFEQQWNDLWQKMQELWGAYWEEYWSLHTQLHDEITKKLGDLSRHPKYSSLPKKKIAEFEAVFACEGEKQIPDTIKDNQFVCPVCENSYSRLEVIRLKDIENKFHELQEILDKSSAPLPAPSIELVAVSKTGSAKHPVKSLQEKKDYIISNIQSQPEKVVDEIYLNLLELEKNPKKK